MPRSSGLTKSTTTSRQGPHDPDVVERPLFSNMPEQNVEDLAQINGRHAKPDLIALRLQK